MTTKHIIELTTYEEIPQFLKLKKQDITLPNDKVWYMVAGIGLDYLLFIATPNGYLPVGMSFLILSKCVWDEYLKWQLFTMKSIRETTERTEPEQPKPLIVNTSTETRLIQSVSDDKHLSNGFVLSGKDYDLLAAYYASNDDKGFRRDDSISGCGVKNLCDGVTSSNFGKFRQSLQVSGYLDDKNEWTDLGVRWLNG